MTENDKKELEQEIFNWADEYAREHGWSLNYDEKQLMAVIRGLARNLTKHDEKYCPCRIRTGDTKTDKEIICPCVYHDEELRTEGHCHCNLFFDDNFFRELLKKHKKPPKQPIITQGIETSDT